MFRLRAVNQDAELEEQFMSIENWPVRHAAIFSPQLITAPPFLPAGGAIRRAPTSIASQRNAMPNARRTTAVALDHRVWRDLALLAAKGLAVGIVVSLLIGLAVFAVA